MATDTIYVANTADDTVSAIDGATCNGSDTAGCNQSPPRVAVGRPSFGGIAVDPASDLVYATNGFDDTVSIIDGATCNATQTGGCDQTPPTVPGGGGPSAAAVNPNDGTVCVVDSGAATATFFRFLVPQQPTHLTARAGHRSATLSWQPPYDGGLPIIYHVIPSPACPACAGLTTPSTSGIPATLVTGLTRGQTYTLHGQRHRRRRHRPRISAVKRHHAVNGRFIAQPNATNAPDPALPEHSIQAEPWPNPSSRTQQNARRVPRPHDWFSCS